MFRSATLRIAASGRTRAARHRVRRRRTAGAWVRLGAALVALLAPAAAAQDVRYIPRDLYRDSLVREGNSVTFCYNGDGMMAGFEQEFAQALADVLLVEARIRPFEGGHITTPPFDHRLPLMPEQLFVVMAEQCSALVGFALTPSLPEWLILTRPYMSGRMVLVAADPAYERLQDVPLDRPIGSRSMSSADNRLINFLQAQPADRRWRRFPYFSNDIVLDKLKDGTLGLGLVWEPSLMAITGGDPEAAGFHVLATMPFAADEIEIGIATSSKDRYLNELLGQGIEALVADGTVDALLEKHRLQRPGGS